MAQVPFKRLERPEEIAGIVVWPVLGAVLVRHRGNLQRGRRIHCDVNPDAKRKRLI